MIGLLLVDDDALVRAALHGILAAEPDLRILGEATDGADVPEAVARLRPDVVLMDVRMPGVDGITATRRLRADAAEPPKILVLTTFEHDDYVYEALRAGAAGFVLKREPPARIAAAIRLVADGDSLLFPERVRALALGRPPVRHRGPALTARETQVLRLIASGRSNTDIATELFVTLETVKTHVGNVLAKLGAANRTQAVIAAYETGLVTAGGR